MKEFLNWLNAVENLWFFTAWAVNWFFITLFISIMFACFDITPFAARVTLIPIIGNIGIFVYYKWSNKI